MEKEGKKEGGAIGYCCTTKKSWFDDNIRIDLVEIGVNVGSLVDSDKDRDD